MKVAMLILAHKNVEQVLRLINRLKDTNIDFYLHADLKWDISVKEMELLKRECTIVQKRVSCSLDGSSLIEAELNLLQEAYETGEYQYYCLISGQDYPICSNKEILKNLEKKYPSPIIDITPYKFANWVWFKFNASQWFKDKNTELNKNNSNINILKKIKKIVFLIWDIVFIQKGNTLFKKLKKKNVFPYGGSEWWILPDEVVREILIKQEKDKEICNLIKKGFTPDEIFFQTLIMTTEEAKNIHINAPYDSERNCATYIDFGGNGKPIVAHPYILGIENIKQLKEAKKKGYLFARKFDIDVDREILDYLDKIV